VTSLLPSRGEASTGGQRGRCRLFCP
jgi:hypothetical protein